MKTYAGAAGDGSTDDTHTMQSTLDDHKGKDVIIFFPAGTYIVTPKVQRSLGRSGVKSWLLGITFGT